MPKFSVCYDVMVPGVITIEAPNGYAAEAKVEKMSARELLRQANTQADGLDVSVGDITPIK